MQNHFLTSPQKVNVRNV